MISRVYIMSCDSCRGQVEVLQGANSIGGAFKAAKRSKWSRDHSNTRHICPACMEKADAKLKEKKDDAKPI